MQFTKLFQSILDSTIWQEPSETKILWITMLAMADRNGEVQASMPGLAKRAGITLAQCESGLNFLLSPDRYSRTPDHEGRRVAPVDGGWQLLNHGKYRALLSAEERREYNRRKQAEYRAGKTKSANVNDASLTVIDSQSQSAMCTHSEGEAEGEATKTLGEPATPSAPTTKAKVKKPARTDAEIVAAYSADIAYRGIDVAAQLSKMRNWCAVNHKEPTERRFVNWLNRCEASLAPAASTAQTRVSFGARD